MPVKPGDAVVVETKERKIRGVIMPSVNKEVLVLKLPNGYNIGILHTRIKKVTIEKRRAPLAGKKLPQQKTGKPVVSILHTGGTIASRVDYETGGVIAQFTPEDLLMQFPEVAQYATIRSRLVANMMSENMRFSHYNILAREIIAEWKQGTTGIVITHGTDTLHFTAAALSFLLPSFPVSIILVGAQRSSDRGSSDAAQNLLAAIRFITKTNYAVTAICMHKTSADGICTLLPGTRTRKCHTSRRDAFQPVDVPPLADIVLDGEIKVFQTLPIQKQEWTGKFVPINEKLKIGILAMHPNMSAAEFSAYKGYDALLLLGTGLGHCPIIAFDNDTKEHEKIFAVVKMLAKRMVVAMASQTGHGRVNMDVYSPGRQLVDAGVIGNLHNMPWETAFIKLACLLSAHDKGETKRLFTRNLVGEITERTQHTKND